MKHTLLTSILLLTFIPFVSQAQNWDYIKDSGEYYYGVGHGATEEEARNAAIAELSASIAMNVKHGFDIIIEETDSNGSVDSNSKVRSVIETCTQSSLSNVSFWQVSTTPEYVIRSYIKRSELGRIFEGRIKKAKDMVLIAEEALAEYRVDMALQYYYWAYSLICSVQYPNEVLGDNGEVLVNRIPLKINEILNDVSVTYEKREGDFVDFLFFYKGHPVTSLKFSHNDGRIECPGNEAKDGRGTIEMAPGYEGTVYKLSVEYQFGSEAVGDSEMMNALSVVSNKGFGQSSKVVKSKDLFSNSDPEVVNVSKKLDVKVALSNLAGMKLTPKASQLATDTATCKAVLDKVLVSLKNKQTTDISSLSYFTLNGLDVFKRLIKYGKGRVVGTPEVHFFKGADGGVVARGLQMSFTFTGRAKKTFVEDVVFYFNAEGKISNIAFGLGSTATNDILCKDAEEYGRAEREIIMTFLENYKTAYSLERLEYIKNIFSDDAVIIVGNVVKRKSNPSQENAMSIKGQEIINYNRYTKDTYIKHLDHIFRSNEFINIRFTNNDVQKLTKFEDKELYAIQIGQEYTSSLYSDKGYLFLLVDMTDPEEPLIRVRTWQPNEVDKDSLYHIGDFYK